MSKQIVDLAVEIADSRDIDLPFKLLKIKDILQKSDSNLSKLKYEIYKYDILEALSVALKNEYGYLKDGWNVAVELAKIFCICTTDFGSVEKQYHDIILPNASENILILAKRIQEKYVKSKAYSEEFLNLFRTLMKEYYKINLNNPFIALKSLRSQRLFQLFLNDEQNTSSIVMNTLKDIFKIKSDLISKLGEKTLFLILDEIMYKMATSDLKEVGLAVFQILNTICRIDYSLIKLIVRRYKGIKMLTSKWADKGLDKEINDFLSMWTGASKTKVEDQDLDNKAVMIQKVWRGYSERKKLKKINQSFAKLQNRFRAKQRVHDMKKQKKMAIDELRFQLMLEHRRKQRQRNIKMLELLEVLPPNQIDKYMEKQREYSACIIQANFRGYRQRKLFEKNKEQIILVKATIQIQRWARRNLERIRKKRQEPAFYSRPQIEPEKREQLFDKIRKHLDSLPPHPRSEKNLNELHEKAQRLFHDYVINQRSIRQQQQKIQVSLAITNNDADILLNCPKLSQVTEEDINIYYSHKSTPVMLAAKEAHKKMLKKQKSKWYEQLMNNSDSDDDYNDYNNNTNDKNDEQLNINLKNLNLNTITNNYYTTTSSQTASSDLLNNKKNHHHHHHHHNNISKRQRNELKTNNLSKSVKHMMRSHPNQSRIWSINLAEDNSKSVYSKN